MTRARKTLTLTRAVYRRVFGNEQQLRASEPSRFLAEIPSELVDTVRGSMAEIGQTRRYEPDPEYSYSADEFLRRVRRGPYQPRASRSVPALRQVLAAPQFVAAQTPIHCSAKKSATRNTEWAPSSASKATMTTAAFPSPSPAAAPKNS